MADSERQDEVESEPDLSSDNMEQDIDYGEFDETQSGVPNENPGVLATPPEGPSASPDVPPSEPTRKKRTREKMTYGVWVHFEKGAVREDGSYDAVCTYCKRVYKMGNQRSTSSMQHHIDKGCKKIPPTKRHKPDALQRLLQLGQQKNDQSPTVWEFDQAKCRKSFAKMVAVHEYPFNCVTHHYLRSFLNDLQPQFKLVSRNTVRSDCIKIYEEEKISLYEVLSKLDCRVSFTSDLWTNKAGDRAFMALTCHYIDDNWKIRKRILNFNTLPSPHTGKNIAEAIYHRLVLWNLDKKTFCLTLDNASSNDACIKELLNSSVFKASLPVQGDVFHQRCSCHILNLIVQDGLAVLPQLVTKVRETMKYIRHSPQRLDLFKLACTQVNVPTNKRPCLDVPTRWNSTFLMLKLAIELKPAICRYGALETKLGIEIDDSEWEEMGALVGYLKVFYDATLKLSGSKYPTLNLFFPEFCEVHLNIKKMESSASSFVVQMGRQMYAKWEKYWNNGSMLLAIACVLDPRCKLAVVEYYFGMIYPDSSQNFISNLVLCLNSMFSEYLEAHSRSTNMQAGSSSQSQRTSSAQNIVSGTRAGLKQFISSKKSTEPLKTDLELYLADPLDSSSLDDEFDILAWWNMKAPVYPVLSRLTRDILAVPISTVALEAAFSVGGRTLSSVRNSLNNESMEALICAQDWLRASITENGGEIGAPLWPSDELDAADIAE